MAARISSSLLHSASVRRSYHVLVLVITMTEPIDKVFDRGGAAILAKGFS